MTSSSMLVSFFSILNSVEKTPKTNEKKRLLMNFKYKDELSSFLKPSYDNNIKLQISEDTIGEITPDVNNLNVNPKALIGDFSNEEKVFDLFTNLVNRLNNRDVTGNAARDEIKMFLEYVALFYKEDGVKWFSRILIKQLRIGLNAKSLSSVFGIQIKKFEVQNAENSHLLTENVKEFNDNPSDFIIERKIDGFRHIVVFEDDELKFYSRNGKSKNSYPTITKELLKQKESLRDYVIDCEVFSVDWNTTASIVQSTKTKVDDTGLILNAFDIIPKKNFIERNPSKLKYHERMKLLREVLKEDDHVKYFESFPIVKKEDAMRYYNQFINEGCEGAMLKNINSLYEFKRNKNWIKIKPELEGDFLCTAVHAGSGKFSNTLGEVTILLDNGLENKVSAFTDEERERFWKDPTLIVGHYIMVKYMETTKDGRLRHATFVRMRYDLDGEKND